MKRLAWFVASGAMVAWGLTSALGGCSSDDATVGDSDEAGSSGSSGTSSGTSGASGGTSGTTSGGTSGSSGGTSGSSGGTDAGDAGDAAKEAAVDSGALVSTPDKVECGSHVCTAPAEFCCRGLNDAGCESNGGCAGAAAKLECDEKADCTGTDVCCQQGLGTTCKADCGMSYQACKTNAECKGGTCFVNHCPGFGGIPATIVTACSKIMQCTQ